MKTHIKTKKYDGKVNYCYMVDKETNEKIAVLSTQYTTHDNYKEVGYCVYEENDRRKGYGKRLLKHYIKLSKTYGYSGIQARIHNENVASISLAKSCGLELYCDEGIISTYRLKF